MSARHLSAAYHAARMARALRILRTDPPPLQPLLFWQCLGLFWLLGLLACRWPWASALCALALLWIDSRFWRPWRLPALVAALLLWTAGWAVNAHVLPQRPETSGALPHWASVRTAVPTKTGSAEPESEATSRRSRTEPPRLEAVVDTVQGLPDGRIRVLLRDLHPLPQPSAPESNAPPVPALPGLVNWVWEPPAAVSQPLSTAAPLVPVEGQRVRLSLPLRDTYGFRNVDAEDTGLYWERRNVFWRLWSRGQAGQPEWLGAGDTLARVRAEQKHMLTSTLAQITAGRAASGQELLHSAHPVLTQAQAFLPALLFGDRSHLHTDTVERMTAASLVHSLALSGQHLALAVLCGVLLVRVFGALRPQIYLHVPRPKLMVLCSLPPALLYLWLGGAPASLLRAFAMLILLALLLCRNKPRTLADVLIPALLAITLVHPPMIFDLGLQLSALCVAAIALLLPSLRMLTRRLAQALYPLLPLHDPELSTPWWRTSGRALLHILCISLGIQVALLPIFLQYFGTFSPWFALNVLWLPVLGLWVLPLAALGQVLLAVHLTAWAGPLLALATLPCAWLLEGLELLARHGWLDAPVLLRPHWTALPGWAALVTALALLPGRIPCKGSGSGGISGVSEVSGTSRTGSWHAGARLATLGVLLLLAGPVLRHAHSVLAPLSLEMLDVGQGQALRIALPGGQSVLVDGGGGLSPRFDPGRDLVAPRLTHNNAPRLLHVIGTHPDVDHMRGLIHILRTFAVERFQHNGEPLHPRDAALLHRQNITLSEQTLHAGMVLPLPTRSGPPLYLEVLHPPAHSVFKGNNNSLVLRLVQQGRGLALLTGDVELAALKHLLASGQDLRAEVLVLPHHGSKRSLLPAFYDAVAPRLALASSGRDNRFGFPDPAVRQALHQRGIPLRNTAEQGAVLLRWEESVLREQAH